MDNNMILDQKQPSILSNPIRPYVLLVLVSSVALITGCAKHYPHAETSSTVLMEPAPAPVATLSMPSSATKSVVNKSISAASYPVPKDRVEVLREDPFHQYRGIPFPCRSGGKNRCR